MKYGNLYDFLLEKKDDPAFNGNKLEEREFREALRILEDDDVISVIGHSSAPTIRFNKAWTFIIFYSFQYLFVFNQIKNIFVF